MQGCASIRSSTAPEDAVLLCQILLPTVGRAEWRNRHWPRASVSVLVKEILAVLIERGHLKKVFLQLAANPGDGVCGKVVTDMLCKVLVCVLYRNQDFPGPSLKCTHI